MGINQADVAEFSSFVSNAPTVSHITFYVVGDQRNPVVSVSLIFNFRTYFVTMQKYEVGTWSLGDTSEAYLYAQEQDQGLMRAIMKCMDLMYVEDSFQALSDYFEALDVASLCDKELSYLVNLYK